MFIRNINNYEILFDYFSIIHVKRPFQFSTNINKKTLLVLANNTVLFEVKFGHLQSVIIAMYPISLAKKTWTS